MNLYLVKTESENRLSLLLEQKNRLREKLEEINTEHDESINQDYRELSKAFEKTIEAEFERYRSITKKCSET